MDEIRTTFRIVTPMFLGGAEPNERAELRTASIKGALRFWYRAVEPDYRQNEPKLFGSTEEGQGVFSLTLSKSSSSAKPREWNKDSYKGYDQEIRHGTPPAHSSTDGSTWRRNGNVYLGFSLTMGENKRKAIWAGEEFTIKLTFRKPLEDLNQRKGIIAALWLLGHVGGLGSRSRRGFGTIALRSWALPTNWFVNDEPPPLAHGAGDVEDWNSKFKKGLQKIKEWFPGKRIADHTVLGENTMFYLFKLGNRVEQKSNSGRDYVYEPWESAMDVAGKTMQGFRQRWSLADTSSDYYRVKQHLLAKKEGGEGKTVNGLTAKYLRGQAPARVVFGLPLAFRYSSLRDKTITFQGVTHDRNASPLFIRIVEIGGKCYPFFALLDAPLLALNEQIADSNDVKNSRMTGGTPRHSYKPQGREIISDFCSQILESESEVIKW